jgi:hypothetical protein|tara:strand:- start:754 stop:867 length:114 start_codon:yes stop_codon:yes gene_type:complete
LLVAQEAVVLMKLAQEAVVQVVLEPQQDLLLLLKLML